MSLPEIQRCVFLTGPERIEIRRVEVPSPGAGELLVRIEAAITCGTDVKVFRRGGHPRMLSPPCPFGHEMSGRVAAVGAEVDRWSIDDPVVVANSSSCGHCPPCRRGRENLCSELDYLNGAFAEYVLLPERFVRRSLHRRPADLEPATAALAEPLACVVHGLERMDLPEPDEVLVLGGGPIGLMFVFLLAHEGHRVTLLDPHTERRRLAGELGAERSAAPQALGTRRSFAAAVDATGTPDGWRTAIEAVRAGGVVDLFGGCAPGTRIELDATRLHYDEITLLGAYHHRPETFHRAIEVLASPGCPLERLISHRAGLDGVGEALRDMSERRAVKVAILPRRG